MTGTRRIVVLYLVMAALIIGTGMLQGWIVGLTILNLCLISAVMALGMNIQWGYAGLFNSGVMGSSAQVRIERHRRMDFADRHIAALGDALHVLGGDVAGLFLDRFQFTK